MSQEKKPFQTANVASISVAHLLHDIYSSFLAPLRPLLIEKFQMTLLLSSLLDIFQRAPNLLNPFAGLIADRGPARYFIIVTPAITAVAMSLLGLAPSYGMLAILLLVMGVSGALFHVPSPVMIQKIAGNRTGKGMSFYMLGGELARTAGPLVITGAVSLWGLEGTWRLIPFGLIASLVLYFRIRKIPVSDDFKAKKTDGGIRKMLRKYRSFFFILLGIIFFRAIVKSALTGFLPTYFFTEKSQTLWFSNISLAVLQIAGAGGTLLAGSISDKLGRKPTLMIATAAIPVVMWLFILAEGVYTLPLLLLLGFFVFAPGPVILALVQDLRTQRPAFFNGIYMTINFASSSVAIVLAGWLGDMLSLQTTYMITGSAAILAIPFIWRLPVKSQDMLNHH
ncbi:MAG: MFS transporter [Bacteroidales bacterium]|nr:MFS transporter [Bacteroidales bacterium]